MVKSYLRKGLPEYYKTFCIIVVNAIIIFIVLNIIAGWYEKISSKSKNVETSSGSNLFKYKEFTPELAPVYPGWDREQVNILLFETRHVTLGYDPFTQFRERPFVGKYVNVDPRGFRPVKNQGPWVPSEAETNIFLFGGSTAFGYGVTDNETIASFLQEILNDSKPTRLARVYNLGRCSYISSQELIFLEKLIQSGIVPDVAIFIDGLNDFAHYKGVPGFTKELTKFMDEGEIPEWKRIVKGLPVVRMFSKKEKYEESNSEIQRDSIIREIVKRYKTNNNLVKVICDKFTIKPLFVWQPTPVYKYDQSYNIFGKFDYERFLPYVRVGYETIAKDYLAGQFGENFLWLAGMQEDLKEPLYVDAAHYSARMSKLIAEQIASALSQKNILP
ncbi:MAG: SGNH/GDSL hydrolase family protein [Deltaproteobacteria bacterium]|nr:SGNH/GDSL hydrolase family protein [Deltaproteobacteria bacterium]